MVYRVLADAVVVLHFAFIAFVVTGPYLARLWRPVVWLHLPALAWAVGIVAVGYECPLTALENHFRRLAGERIYPGGFVDHYIENVIYPQRYTPLVLTLAAMVIAAGYASLVRAAHPARATVSRAGAAEISAGGLGRRLPRHGCRRRCCRTGGTGCGTGRARSPRSSARRTRQPAQLAGPDEVDHRHRGLDRDPVGQRCAGVDRVQVVVPAVVPHQRGHRVPLGQDLVDDPYRLVPVAGQQPPQRGAQRAHRGQLGRVVGPGPGVVVRGEELVQLVRSRHRVRRLRRVHQRDRGLQRRGGVMSEDHVDTLHPHALVSGVMAVLAHDTPSTTRAGTRLASGLGLAVLSASSFGLSGSLARGLMDAGWSSAAAVVVRILLAAAVLVPIALVQLRGRWLLLVRNLRLVAGYGLVAVAGCQLAYFNAVAHMQVGVALLIEYTAPVAVVGWLWLRRGQRPGRLTVLGVLLGAAGLVLVLDLISGAQASTTGILWALGAMVGAASTSCSPPTRTTGCRPRCSPPPGSCSAGSPCSSPARSGSCR
jgi:uncharacterized membrane protein